MLAHTSPSAPPARPLAPHARPHAAIVQSNYLPWKGYLDLIAAVDVFVLYDDVQFTRRDWRNRNRIKTANGPLWLTVPVASKGAFDGAIDTMTVADDGRWTNKHFNALRHAYAKAPYFRDYEEALAGLYDQARSLTRLSAVNRLFLDALCGWFGLTTTLVDARPLGATGSKTDRLIDVCAKVGARGYLSGPAARSYMDEPAMARAGISLAYMEYEGYPAYPQLHGAFDHKVSALDLLFMTGPDAPKHLKYAGAA